MKTRRILLSAVISSALVTTALAKVTTPTEYHHSEYACPAVSAVQKHVWTLKPGQISTWTDHKGLKWRVVTPKKGISTPMHLHGYRGALWHEGNQEVTCRYGNWNSTALTRVTGQFKVVQPRSVPWEELNEQRQTIKHLKQLHSKEHWAEMMKHDMLCDGARPHLCVFELPANKTS